MLYNSRLHWSSLNLIKFYYFYYFWIMVTVCVSLSDVFCLNFLLFTFYCPSFCLKHQFNFKLEMLIRFTLWILSISWTLADSLGNQLLTVFANQSFDFKLWVRSHERRGVTRWLHKVDQLSSLQQSNTRNRWQRVKWMLQYKIIKSDELTTGLLNVLSVMPFVSNMTLQSSCR